MSDGMPPSQAKLAPSPSTCAETAHDSEESAIAHDIRAWIWSAHNPEQANAVFEYDGRVYSRRNLDLSRQFGSLA